MIRPILLPRRVVARPCDPDSLVAEEIARLLAAAEQAERARIASDADREAGVSADPDCKSCLCSKVEKTYLGMSARGEVRSHFPCRECRKEEWQKAMHNLKLDGVRPC